MTHIPNHIAAQIRAEIRAIAEQARTEQAARDERITTAARQAGAEWQRSRNRTTTAAAHIANATRHAAHRPNRTPEQPQTPSE